MTIAGRRGWGVAAGAVLVMLGGLGRTVHAGQMTPASLSQIQQPGQQNQSLPQQQGQNPIQQKPSLPDAMDNGKNDDPMLPARVRQAKIRENERQKRLVSDTEKLLVLATQLHDDVARTNKDILSLDVIKRADEIEKLAHSVKVGMKD
jgi:hypothetical protein